MDISGTSGPYYGKQYTTEQYIPTYGDITTRSIPVTSEISDAPDLTMPVGVCDERPAIFPNKKLGLADRIAKRIYGDED